MSKTPTLFKSYPDWITKPPFETDDLRANLTKFLDMPFQLADGTSGPPVGNYRWGVYAFFDYDGEPIYVGQTNEQLRTRIRRHLTNQRTDAVAMSVLDPFEVFEIAVWPLPQFEGVSPKNKARRPGEGAPRRPGAADHRPGGRQLPLQGHPQREGPAGRPARGRAAAFLSRRHRLGPGARAARPP